jgi:hypothetical protein
MDDGTCATLRFIRLAVHAEAHRGEGGGGANGGHGIHLPSLRREGSRQARNGGPRAWVCRPRLEELVKCWLIQCPVTIICQKHHF